MDGMIAVQAATVALFVLEGIKFVLRWALKDGDFTFAPIFYTLLIPLLTAGAGIGLGAAGLGPVVAFVPKELISWGLAVLVELLLYHMAVEPIKDSNAEYRAGLH
jgi:hypothetical protein